MAIQLPGFDAELIYRVLSDFWKDYKQRDQLATFWGGMSQIMDNEYLQIYQSDFSKALGTVPVYWRYQWPNIEFDSWVSNEVLHEHHWYERTTSFVEERSTGELVEGDGYTDLIDNTINFVTLNIGTGHVVVIGGELYRVTDVIGNRLRLDAILSAVPIVTYEVKEQYFDLIGATTMDLGSCHTGHPTDDNIYDFTASSQIAEIDLPWIYTRGENELTVTRNGTPQILGEDYLETTDKSITFIPSLVDGDRVIVEKAIKIRIITSILSGVFLTEGVDFEIDPEHPFEVKLTEALGARDDDGLGYNIMLKWHDITTPVLHSHRQFEETLEAPKDTWTNAPGDAFAPEPEGNGPYQFGDKNAPLEVWVNGAKEPRALQAEPNSVTLILSEALEAGDTVMLRWIRNDSEPEQHKHLRYTNVLSSMTQSLTLPFGIDFSGKRKHVIYINGVIQTLDDNYSIAGAENNVITFDEELIAGDIVEVEYYVPEYLYKHEIDPLIYAAPVLQDGIDLPTIISIEGEGHEVRPGWLYSNYDFDEVWIPNLFVNEPTTASNFGEPIQFVRDNSLDYLNSVKALWYCYWNGPSFQRIEDGSKILLGVPFSPTETTVVRRDETVSAEDVLLAADDGTKYVVESPLVPTVNAGEDVRAFEPLATGVEVWDYVTNPEWYKQFPNLYQMWDQFSVSGEPYTGYWDDRGFLDDGGFWDDGGPGDPAELEALNKKFFDLIKWFIFVVNIDASLLKSEDSLDDMIFYLDTIKPAYTKYLMLTELPGTDDIFKRRATDSISGEIDMGLDDYYAERWDDGGNMDITDAGFHFVVGVLAQTELTIPFPYRIGDNTLRVWVNSVLQTPGVDYQEVTVTTIQFLAPLTGGENIYIYEDDSVYRVMDRGVAIDNVSFQLV